MAPPDHEHHALSRPDRYRVRACVGSGEGGPYRLELGDGWLLDARQRRVDAERLPVDGSQGDGGVGAAPGQGHGRSVNAV